MTDPQTLVRIAHQHAKTDALFGIDILPTRAKARATVAVAHMTEVKTPPKPVAAAASDREATASADSKPTSPKATTTPSIFGGTVPEIASDNKPAALQELQKRHDEQCPHCTTATYHTQTVFGEGNSDADLMFIGEAPGEQEDRSGRPFVGRAGQKLDEMIKALGLRRDDVYIANILKSRPPENRTPQQQEIDACSPFLTEQIEIIRPKVIVTLGGPATKLLLNTTTGITRLRGQWASYDTGSIQIPVMPTFHPAYLLRNYTVDTRKKVWSDLQMAYSKMTE